MLYFYNCFQMRCDSSTHLCAHVCKRKDSNVFFFFQNSSTFLSLFLYIYIIQYNLSFEAMRVSLHCDIKGKKGLIDRIEKQDYDITQRRVLWVRPRIKYGKNIS